MLGDCAVRLVELEDDSIDSMVTDAPYGLSAPPDIVEVLRHWMPEDPRVVAAIRDLWPHRHIPDVRRAIGRLVEVVRDAREAYQHGTPGFMGRDWDTFVPGPRVWRECLRVLKPGSHSLVFAGTRTVDLMGIALRLAGFEVRDDVEWVYWQGAPKSRWISDDIDKMRHDRDQILEVTRWIRKRRDEVGVSNWEIDQVFGFAGMAGHWTSQASQPSVPTLDQWPRLLEVLKLAEDDLPPRIRELAIELNTRKGQPAPSWNEREVVGTKTGINTKETRWGMPLQQNSRHEFEVTAPNLLAARQWKGWGTGLKPAHEPAILVRKPIAEGTIARQVLATGTGAMNLDACRFPPGDKMWPGPDDGKLTSNHGETGTSIPTSFVFGERPAEQKPGQLLGRWPSNLVHVPKPARKERSRPGRSPDPDGAGDHRARPRLGRREALPQREDRERRGPEHPRDREARSAHALDVSPRHAARRDRPGPVHGLRDDRAGRSRRGLRLHRHRP